MRLWTGLKKKITEIDSVTQMLDRGLTPEQILEEILGDFGLEITDTTVTRFHCDCSKERVSRALSTLSKRILIPLSQMVRALR